MYLKAIGTFAAALLLGACSINHAIESDYPQYLANNAGASQLPRTNRASRYVLPPKTQEYKYEFRAFLTGYANVWEVEIGKMLDDTMQSADVQAAFGRLEKAGAVGGGPGGTLVFEIQNYTFVQFGAHLTLRVSLFQNNAKVFEQVYYADGKTQGAKMGLTGAFGQRNAVQQSTKLAIDDILRRLINDLNASAAGTARKPG